MTRMILTLPSLLLLLVVAVHGDPTASTTASNSGLRDTKNTRFLEGLAECANTAASIAGRSSVPSIAHTYNAFIERNSAPTAIAGGQEGGSNLNDGSRGGGGRGGRGKRRNLLFLREGLQDGLQTGLSWLQEVYSALFIEEGDPASQNLVEPTLQPVADDEEDTAENEPIFSTAEEGPDSEIPAATIFTDVIIIGAGMAGLSAAAELTAADPDLSYIILESTDRTGGRVRAHTMGVSTNRVVVEDGANWIIPFNGNPLWDRAQGMGLAGMTNDYHNWVVYNSTGDPVDTDLVNSELNRFLAAYRKAGDDAEEQWTKNHASFDDQGVLKLLADNGWTIADDALGNLDYIMQWLYIDFEYAAADTSTRFFPYTANNPYLVTDQRGYESVLDNFRDENVPTANIQLNKRVASIDYSADICVERCLGFCLGKSYKAIVTTDDGTEYTAQRVISTVSTGVLEKEYISFTPALKYSSASTNPYEMTQYIKIFYQFPIQFWDDEEFVEVALTPENRGKCHHWQNMELAIPGSVIIRCEIMTEAFESLLDPTTQELSDETLIGLLDPLKAVYGDAVVGTPIDIYYPKINKDIDFGNGAYGNWKIGKTFTDFAHFFGGVTDLASYCDHNGCNAGGEWIVQLSGSASCYDYSEFVHGAYFSGQRSARFALESLGYSGIRTDSSGCDTYWNELT